MADTARPSPARVLVTGGTGFVGSQVVSLLLAAEHPVRVYATPETVGRIPRADRVEVASGDIADEDGLREATSGIETVYHLAGLLGGSPLPDLLRVNAGGTENVARACGQTGSVRRLVYPSSVAVYRHRFDVSAWPLTEASPLGVAGPRAAGAYGLSKIVAEASVRRWARSCGFDYTILRASMSYGSGSHYSESLVRQFLDDVSLVRRSSGGPILQLIHAKDLATSIVRAGRAPRAANRIFNIAGLEPVSYRNLGILIRRLAGIVDWPSLPPDRSRWFPDVYPFEVDKAVRTDLLTYRVSLREGLAEVIGSLPGSGADA